MICRIGEIRNLVNEIVEYIATEIPKDTNGHSPSDLHSILTPLSSMEDMEDVYWVINLNSPPRVTQREQTHDRDSIREMASSDAKRVKTVHPFLY